MGFVKKKSSLSGLKKKVWKLCSEFVRRKHADEGGTVSCFTCGQLMYWKEAQAGHAIGGRTNAVLFDIEIIRPQCVRCNVMLRGNYPVFTTRLIRQKGLRWFEKKLIDARQPVILKRSDLEELAEEFSILLGGLNAR